ncbi:MAG: serine hydrolase [Leptolyngbyaceae cyanobacterium SM1_1_3]|nr:serine hydrolase [Leptolyngbyaceae cyanobacterium SM1_1_3]NJN02941.1 serine hydrolase [Leptolyngbyaceae cyanobacterium RM1_1_2]
MANYGDRSRPIGSHRQADEFSDDPYASAAQPASKLDAKPPSQPQLGLGYSQRRPRRPAGNPPKLPEGFSLRQWLGGSPRRRQPLSHEALPVHRRTAATPRPSSAQVRLPVANPGEAARTSAANLADRLPRSARPVPRQSKPQALNATSSKVTPLRPRQVWPPHPSSASPRPGEAPVRRSHRPRPAAPPPIVYAMRLLILGVGIAAIAGTLLSVLSPERVDYATSEGNLAQPTVTSPARPRASLVNRPIQISTEITHLKAKIEELGTLTPGLTQSVFLLDLDSGAYVDIAGGEAMPAASTLKTPILIAFLQAVDAGLVQLDQPLVMRQEQIVGGSGEMQTQPAGTQYSALEVATEMIVDSDNTATNMLIDLLGGAEVLNQEFRNWGLEDTIIRNPLPDIDGTNTTSPKDLVMLMALVNRGDLLTLRSRDRLLTIMQRTHTRTLIPAGLDSSAIVANKTGDIGSTLGDIALVDLPNGKRYAIAAIVQRPHNDGRARELIRRVSQTVYQEFTQAVSAPGGTVPSAPNSGPEQEMAPPG